MLTCSEIWTLAARTLPVLDEDEEHLTIRAARPDGELVTTVTLFPFNVFDQDALLLIARVCPQAALSEYDAMRLSDRMDGILALFEGGWGLRLVLPCATLDWELVVRAIQHLVQEVLVIRQSLTRAMALCCHHLVT